MLNWKTSIIRLYGVPASKHRSWLNFLLIFLKPVHLLKVLSLFVKKIAGAQHMVCCSLFWVSMKSLCWVKNVLLNDILLAFIYTTKHHLRIDVPSHLFIMKRFVAGEQSQEHRGYCNLEYFSCIQRHIVGSRILPFKCYIALYNWETEMGTW